MKRKAVTLQLEGEIPQPQSAYDAAVENGYEGSEEQYGKELATIPPTQEQFDAIPGRISKLTTTTEKSDFHHITDSAADKVVEFGMEGNTEQETTPGNQLFDKNSIAIINELLQNDGTPFPNVNYVHTDFIEVTPNETYSLTMFNTAYLFSGIWVYDESKTFVEKPSSYLNSYSIAENGKYLILGFTKAEYGVFTEDDIKAVSDGLMLVKGSTKPTTYEPYTNGPSPNPDYPQEIVNAGKYNESTGRYEIGCKVGNRNLWDVEYASDVNNWVKPEWYEYIPIKVSKGATISISYKQSLNTGLRMFVAVGQDGNQNTASNWLYHSGAPTLINNEVSFIAKNDYIYLHCHGIIDIDGQLDKFMQYIGNDLQIEIADTPTSYTPHACQPLTLTSPVPLTKWDYLTKRDGVWGWSIQAKEYNVSTEEASISPNNPDAEKIRIYIRNITGPNNTECLCNLFRTSSYSGVYYGEWGIWWGNKICSYVQNELLEPYGYIYDSESTENSTNAKAAFKALLAEKGPIQVWVDMQEEQAFHPLPDEEQELLKNLETYYGVTNLYNDQGCPMWLTYVQDTKIAVDNKFNNIKTALLSLGANI